MSDKQEPIIDAHTVETPDTHTEEQASAPKRKLRLKLHLTLTLLLGVATWAWITYAPTAQIWKERWIYPLLNHQPTQTKPAEPTAEAEKNGDTVDSTESLNDAVATTDESTEHAADDSPLFETVTPEPTPTEQAVTNIEPQTTNQTPALSEETSSAVLQQLHSLQQQVQHLTQRIEDMQSQQLKWAQQQVGARLFALLHTAATPQAKLDDMMIAWKSISLLPLLNQSKRDTASQAVESLQTVQQHMAQTSADIQTLIDTLAEKMHPKALREVAQQVEHVRTPEPQDDTWNSWLDWLKQQFIITRLDKHALERADDPYADTKQLIMQLDTLKSALEQQQWQHIGSLTTLLYQLEQRGLEADFSNESIADLQAEIQRWQDEARMWMEQL